MTAKNYKNYKCGPTQDYFSPDPGVIEGPLNCGVCGTGMNKKSNVLGPRGFTMAISGGKELHDVFWCPHREEMWHKQALNLRFMASDTSSSRLAAMLMGEAEDVIASRTTTKVDGF